MVISPTPSKPISDTIIKDQIILDWINLKETLKASTLNNKIISIKKKPLPERFAIKLILKDVICI